MLTSEQILALSPDDSSSKAAKGLLAPAKWPTLGHDESAIWGECQGSGSKPYQVAIDVGGPTFKCTCPSRKFPCKHGLALYLLLAQKQSSFTTGAPPPWVSEWMSARKDRAEKKAEKQAAQEAGAATAPPDPAAAAKREAKRLERVVAGARDLERWLGDLVKHGIGELPARPASYWREISARMVDAQATGLAAGVRQMEALVHTGAGWPERTLAQMGRMQLLVDAVSRLDTLPAGLRSEVRTACGWPVEREEVLATGERVSDRWLVCGQSFEENEKLWERRVWLKGQNTHRWALLLDFSHGQRKYEQGFVSGSLVEVEAVYFPGSLALRALCLGTAKVVRSIHTDHDWASISWEAAMEGVAEATASQPWVGRLPLGISGVVPTCTGGQWTARDEHGAEGGLRLPAEDAWVLTALSGGRPLTLFGEWNGEVWRPLTAWTSEATEVAWMETTTASA